MKSNRELVLELLLQTAKSGDHPNGLSTQFMAQRLNIQRTNLSSVLNALVRDKKLEKVNGRPVLYRLAGDAVSTTWRDESCFSELLGPRNLLYPAIQLIKAAELYPGSPIPILISGPVGCGKTEFLKVMFRFAQTHNVLTASSQMIRLDCSEYLVDPKSFHRKLFDPADGLISHMEDHFIVLEQVDRLAQGELKELTSLLQNREGGLLAAVINEASQEASVQNAAAGFFPAQIRLPALSEWSLSDRLNLIQRNFVFRSKGNLAKQIGWYVLAFCVITCIAFVGMLFLFRPVACRCDSMHFFLRSHLYFMKMPPFRLSGMGAYIRADGGALSVTAFCAPGFRSGCGRTHSCRRSPRPSSRRSWRSTQRPVQTGRPAPAG